MQVGLDKANVYYFRKALCEVLLRTLGHGSLARVVGSLTKGVYARGHHP